MDVFRLALSQRIVPLRKKSIYWYERKRSRASLSCRQWIPENRIVAERHAEVPYKTLDLFGED